MHFEKKTKTKQTNKQTKTEKKKKKEKKRKKSNFSYGWWAKFMDYNANTFSIKNFQ